MKFELIKGTETLKGTCYFEFIKNSHRKKTCWNENAYYLSDGVFIYFVNVFSKSSDRFDYYSFCKFNQFELKDLSKNLSEFIKRLRSIKSLEEFRTFFENDYQHIILERKSETVWNKRIKDLIAIACDLEILVKECYEENQVFWVLGL